MAEFLGVSYYVARAAYKRLKIKPVPSSCKDAYAKRKRPSIEEYKAIF